MNLVPYTTETYFSLLQRFNEALWPFHLIALALLSLIFICLFNKQIKKCFGLLFCATFWAFIGTIYYNQWLSELTWAANWFMFACLIQGFMLVLIPFLYHTEKYETSLYENTFASRFLMVTACSYPVIAAVVSYGWPALPMICMTPIATFLLTFALLCQLRFSQSLMLGIVPFFLSLFIALEAYELGVHIKLLVILGPMVWLYAMINEITRQESPEPVN